MIVSLHLRVGSTHLSTMAETAPIWIELPFTNGITEASSAQLDSIAEVFGKNLRAMIYKAAQKELPA